MNYYHQHFCETWVYSYVDSLPFILKHNIAIVINVNELTDLSKLYSDILENSQVDGIRIQNQLYVENIIEELLENEIHIMMYHKENPGQVFVWIHSNNHLKSLIPCNWTDDWQMILFNNYGEKRIISEFTRRKWWEISGK